ncbi:MAG: hypothetical protein Q9202_003084 [Teloschistes flavicans]
MPKFFKRLSFASRPTRSAIAPKSSEPQDSSQQRVAELYTATLRAINNYWTEGLIEFDGFDLHSALSIFKTLLRTLRSAEHEQSPSTTSDEATNEAPPYRFLLPEEIALLYVNIALIHGFLGSYYLAAIAFDEALLLDEASAVAWFGLGIAKFYLHELRASKTAFRKCHNCFLSHGDVGTRHWRDEITYKVWNGSGEQSPNMGYAVLNDSHKTDDASGLGLLQTNVFAKAFPNGMWKLRRSQVVWNFEVIVRERHSLQKKGQEGAGARTQLQGIPVGVIFGLDVEARNRLVSSNDDNNKTSIHFVKKHARGDSAETVIPYGSNPVGELRGTPANFIKQKWAAIQQRLKSRRIDPAATARILALSPPNAPAMSDNPNHQGRPISRGRMDTTPTQGSVGHQNTRPRSASLPSSSFNSRVIIPNRFEDALSDEDDRSSVSTDINIGNRINSVSLNNRPHEYLISPDSPATSFQQQRSSCSSSSLISNMMQAVDSFREELEADAQGDRLINRDSQNKNDINNETHSPSSQYVQHHQDPADHYNANSPNTTHDRRVTTIQPGDIVLPNLIHDLTTDAALETYILPATRYVPLPRAAPCPLSDSFMTDGVSSLASHDRAHMFPSLDSAPGSRGPSSAFVDSAPPSRRPSMDHCKSPNDQHHHYHPHHSPHSSNGTIIWNPVYEEAYERLSGRRTATSSQPPAPAVEITSATPTQFSFPPSCSSSSSSLPVTATSTAHPASTNTIDDLLDSYAIRSPAPPPAPNTPHWAQCVPEADNTAAVIAALNAQENAGAVGKWGRADLRMGACGRECLGEWEWEEAYGKWRVREGLEEGGDDDEEVEEEGKEGEGGEEGGAVGEGGEGVQEMLKPVCFEGL